MLRISEVCKTALEVERFQGISGGQLQLHPKRPDTEKHGEKKTFLISIHSGRSLQRIKRLANALLAPLGALIVMMVYYIYIRQLFQILSIQAFQ